MRYGYIGGLDKPVSRIVLGTTAIDAGDQSRSDALLDAAWAAGITAFDTALVYPNGGEIALGRWLRSRGIIDQAVVITKGAHHDAHRRRVTPEDIQADCRQSIDRLGTGCIDLYLLHRDDPAVPVGEIVDALHSLQAAGMIRIFGGSNWTAARLAEANAYAASRGWDGMRASSPHYALGVQQADLWGGGVSITGDAGAADRAYYRQTGMPVLAYSPLCHGVLSGKWRAEEAARMQREIDDFARRGYFCKENLARLRRCEQLAAAKGTTVATVALAWLMHQMENVFAVAGASRPERAAQLAEATALALTAEEVCWLSTGEEKA